MKVTSRTVGDVSEVTVEGDYEEVIKFVGKLDLGEASKQTPQKTTFTVTEHPLSYMLGPIARIENGTHHIDVKVDSMHDAEKVVSAIKHILKTNQ